MFRKFGYRDTRKATDKFNTIIGQGGFGTVYKARFHDGLVVAVKQMNMVSKQAEDEFCREIELLARLHHRHLVSLRGFCIKRHERSFSCVFCSLLIMPILHQKTHVLFCTLDKPKGTCFLAGFSCMNIWKMEA